MVAVKNVLISATCVASALAAPMEATKRQWGGWNGNGGGNNGMSQWGQQGQGQAQGQGQSQGQGQAQGGQDASASTGSSGNSSTAAAGTSSLAATSGETISTSTSGMSGDWYYQNWMDGSGATMTLGDGQYSVEWTEAAGNVVSGIGWNPASAKTITYEADVQASGNWYLSLYGWTKNPLVEFYIVETFGSYDPSSAASSVGTADIDGSTYTLLQTTRTNQPSIEGTSTFQQYWAVRQDHRTSGSIDFGAHIDAWKNAGFEMGDFDYMILATEGYQSSGSSTVKVSA